MDGTKVITCRTHGGNFRVPIKRGRPPVNCTPENKCRKSKAALSPKGNAPTLAHVNQSSAMPARGAESNVSAKETAAMVKLAEWREKNGEAEAAPERTTGKPLGVTKAFQAKAQLEALGWECKGEKLTEGKVRLTATRGVELLIIVWAYEGVLLAQDYSLWDTTVGTGRNGKPQSKLPWDPEEMTDGELVRELTGMKVTWWNSLAQAETSDVIQAGTIKIERSYESNGDEVYGDRIVKFIGYGGGGFRAFRVAALMKVG